MKSVSIIKNVPDVPDNYTNMIFGRQLDYRYKIADYMAKSKNIHLSQKKQTYKKAIKEFVDLYKPKNYYIPKINCDEFYYDDSFVVYYQN